MTLFGLFCQLLDHFGQRDQANVEVGDRGGHVLHGRQVVVGVVQTLEDSVGSFGEFAHPLTVAPVRS